jgi:hypothetical protein
VNFVREKPWGGKRNAKAKAMVVVVAITGILPPIGTLDFRGPKTYSKYIKKRNRTIGNIKKAKLAIPRGGIV